MSKVKILSAFMALGWFLFLPQVSHSQEPKKFGIISAGIRGGLNLKHGGIPPGEKEDFHVIEAFTILGFPGSWEWPNGWEARYNWQFTAGILRGAGDEGFMGTTGPGLSFTNWDWRVTFDVGTGAAFFSDEKFGNQDFGGPVQIIGHGGLSYHFPQQITLGWRFRHFSDATLYGNNNRGIDMHLLELSYRF